MLSHEIIALFRRVLRWHVGETMEIQPEWLAEAGVQNFIPVRAEIIDPIY
jgi:hypothetical protein